MRWSTVFPWGDSGCATLDPDWDDDPPSLRLYFEKHDSIGGYDIDDGSIDGSLPWFMMPGSTADRVYARKIRQPDYSPAPITEPPRARKEPAAPAKLLVTPRKNKLEWSELASWQWRCNAERLGLFTKADYLARIRKDLYEEINPHAIKRWLHSDEMKCDHRMFRLTHQESESLFEFARERLVQLGTDSVLNLARSA